MVIIPIPYLYSVYTKKEDARDVANNQRRASALVLIGLATVTGVMQLFVVPKIMNLYSTFDTRVPMLTQSSPYITGIIAVLSIVIATYLLSTKPDYSKVDAIASKHKEGEMIKTRELMDKKLEWYPMTFMILGITYLVLSIILPIYTLTSQVE